MAPVFLSSEIPNGVKCRAALTAIALLLAVMISAGCGSSEPIESAAQVTDESVARGSTGEAEVIATTSGGPEEREATTGVASTTVQNEASASETSDPGTSETSKALAEIPTQQASGPEASVFEEAPFVASPQAGGGAGYGADGVLSVRYGVHEGYERIVVDLGTGEEPANSVPEWTLSSPAGDGTLRVTFPSISTTSVSDGTFGGPLLKDFHVVHAPEGGMFVDIFSNSAFTYRAIELSNPARLVVDFKPSSASLELPLPAEAANTVLTQPRSGARVGGALTVSGYSRNPEATNTVILTNAGGETIVKDTVMSNDWTTTWGYFETTLNVPNFSGEGTLKVGARSARDGAFEGVETPVYGTG